MHGRTSLLCAVVASITTSATIASAADQYTNHRVVRVTTSTQTQFEKVMRISNDCWCENPGVGVRDFLVSPEGLMQLAVSNVPFEILIDDVQGMIDDERTRLRDAELAAGANWYDDFKPLADIEARIQGWANDYPGIVQLVDIGDSIEGNDIWALRISGSASDKPAVLFNATQHAREWISPMVLMYITEQFITQYGVDARITQLVDELEILVVPVVNPDGYEYTWLQPNGDRLWRKNRRDNGDGTIGVDPNRNWETGWGGAGASPITSDPTYYGTAPFSEPETQAMKAFYEANPNVVASIDFHAYSQLVLYPYAYQFAGPGDEGQHAALGNEMVDAIRDVHGLTYVDGPVADTLYQASGGSVDWSWDARGAISYTIELRPASSSPGFIIPPDQIIPCAEENFPAALAMADAAASGAIFGYPSDRPTMVAPMTGTTFPVEILPVGADLDTASGRLMWRLNGAGSFNELALTHLGGTDYEASLPGLVCGSEIEYFLEIDDMAGGTAGSPSGAPAQMYVASVVEQTFVFSDSFEADNGWTVENTALDAGAWERGVPAGDGDRGDPLTDFDGSGACYLTENVAGNSDVDGGPTRLVSPAVDLTGMTDPQLTYARWFTSSSDITDALVVELSATGSDPWTVVETVVNSGGWTERTVRVSDYITPSSTVHVRFTVSDNPNDSVVEAAIDGVSYSDVGCDGPAPTGDVDGDGFVDFADLLAVLAAWGPCPSCAADIDGSGVVDFADLLILLSNWTT